MIQEDFCSFEVAKLLKEKGFDGECSMVYTIEGELLFAGLLHHNLNITSNTHSKYFSDIIATSPTLQMAMKWLREVHNINIEIRCNKNNAEAFIMTIEELPRCLCRGISSNKYEETCEAAIKYCLVNII